MTGEKIKEATGRGREDWFALIRGKGLADAPHKTIADFLHEKEAVAYWWAQTITVEFEKHKGRRVTGQTQDGKFQLGTRKTLGVPLSLLWGFLESPPGIALLTGSGKEDAASLASRGLGKLATLDGQSSQGIIVLTTTYEKGSHLRMRWQAPSWPAYSILQVRLTSGGAEKTTLTFHQEKLPSLEARQAMRERWKRVAAEGEDFLTRQVFPAPAF